MLRIMGMILLLSLSANDAIAQTEVAKCKAINDDKRRLTCYDFAVGRNSKKTERKGKWYTQIKNNPIDDTAIVIARAVSDSGRSTYGKKIIIIARCKSHKTTIYIDWSSYLGGDKSKITTGIDNKPAQTESWSVSTDNQATFAPNPIMLLRQLAKGNRYVARLIPYRSNPIVAVFNLTGSAAAIGKVAEECGWELN